MVDCKLFCFCTFSITVNLYIYSLLLYIDIYYYYYYYYIDVLTVAYMSLSMCPTLFRRMMHKSLFRHCMSLHARLDLQL